MRNKTKRLLTIRKLIESELISSQEELLFRLKEMNVEATQSTLSRDLKFMKVAKIPHKEKGYIYVIPESIQNEQREEKVSAIITDTILSIDFSGNMAVIKTLPGYANAVTVLIDSENYFEILGTIAGDDTIFIVMREGVSRSELIEALTYSIEVTRSFRSFHHCFYISEIEFSGIRFRINFFNRRCECDITIYCFQ